MNTAILSQTDEDIRIEKMADGSEKYIFDPFNPLNKEITPEDVASILRQYGIHYPIQNFQLYRRAFVHRSYIRRPAAENDKNHIEIMPKPDNCLPLYTKSNERLEFVGDGVLECITKFSLYRRFPKEQEGFMTEKKIALVKNESLGRLALDMGLHKWFILSKHVEMKQTRTNLKKLGCLFEAFLGALFLDFNRVEVPDFSGISGSPVIGPGFQLAQVFIESVYEKHVDWMNLIQNDDNYKNILQVRIQKEFKVTPIYMEIEHHNQDGGYNMGVYLCLGQSPSGLTHFNALSYKQFDDFGAIHQYMAMHGKIFLFLGEGKHKIKKKAEQIACDTAIRNLMDY
jgi:dsRNA-specific ribonuclease